MDLILTYEQVFPKGAYLAQVRPWYEYSADGKRTSKQLGLIYVFVNRNGYEKVNVRVKAFTPIISNDEIKASSKDIGISAKGFQGRLYHFGGNTTISADAQEVCLI